MEKLFIIYKVTHLVTLRTYIGQTKNGLEHRRYQHLRDSREQIGSGLLHAAIREFGIDQFSWEILEECRDREHLNERERFYIKLLNTLHPNGYNRDSGGKAGKEFSEQTIEKLRNLNTAEKNPMFGKPAWNRGVPASEETRIKQSQARIALADMPGFVHPTLGQKRTPEQIEKSSKGPRMRGAEWHESHKNQFTDEVRKVMSEKAKARKPNISKPVVCLDTGVVYASAREASRQLNLSYQKISQCCLGNRLTHGKLKWAFVK